MKILFFGDVVGALGRLVLAKQLPLIKASTGADFVIVNGENATHGKGLSKAHYEELVKAGADCITLGNHYHAKTQIDRYIDDAPLLVRPLNLINYHYGKGSKTFDVKGIKIRVTNLLGQAFLEESVLSPVLCLSDFLSANPEPCLHIVDFHAESTSEKQIFGYYFASKVSAVIGTHTHVQTNDAKILAGKTAYISDVGMCGASEGVIGFNKESVINKIVYGQNGVFELDRNGEAMVNALLMEYDEKTYNCLKVTTINVKDKIV